MFTTGEGAATLSISVPSSGVKQSRISQRQQLTINERCLTSLKSEESVYTAAEDRNDVLIGKIVKKEASYICK